MKRIVVCDDNAESITHIKSLLKQYITEKNKEAEILYYSSGEKMLEDDAILQKRYETDNTPLNNRKKIDIAILDVEMDRLSGIQTGYEVHKRYPEAILMITTAYMRYLDDAMDLRVFRYFEKPVDKERLFSALDIIFREKKTIHVELQKETRILHEHEIACISSKFRKTEIVTAMGEVLLTKSTLKDWLTILNDDNTFGIPHNSYIVNLNYIRSLGNDFIIVECKNGKQIKIYASKRRYPAFKRQYFDKMGEYK